MAKVIYTGNGWQKFTNGEVYDADLEAKDENGKNSWFVYLRNAPFIFRGRRGYFVYDHQKEFKIISDSPYLSEQERFQETRKRLINLGLIRTRAGKDTYR